MRGRIGIYTDQELDSETGLYNYDTRLYDPVIGRFISPDSVVPDWYDPQSLNRYSYCRNNPLRYTDPSGHYDNDMEHGGRAVGAQGRGGAGPGSGLGGDPAAGNGGGSESSGSPVDAYGNLENSGLFIDSVQLHFSGLPHPVNYDAPFQVAQWDKLFDLPSFSELFQDSALIAPLADVVFAGLELGIGVTALVGATLLPFAGPEMVPMSMGLGITGVRSFKGGLSRMSDGLEALDDYQ